MRHKECQSWKNPPSKSKHILFLITSFLSGSVFKYHYLENTKSGNYSSQCLLNTVTQLETFCSLVEISVLQRMNDFQFRINVLQRKSMVTSKWPEDGSPLKTMEAAPNKIKDWCWQS